MNLQSLFTGSKTSGKRVGRGQGSGKGKTAGRGTKGQNSRTGAGRKIKAWFEGGQTPLYRQMAKRRGFKLTKPKSITVTTEVLDRLFAANDVVSPQTLREKNIIRTSELNRKIKIVRRGTATTKFQFQDVAVSKSLQQ